MTDTDWTAFHHDHIHVWDDRVNHMVVVEPGSVPGVSGYYNKWYRRRTRKWMSKSGAIFSYLVHTLTDVCDRARGDTHLSMSELEKMCTDAIHALVITHPEEEEIYQGQG